MSHPMRDNSCSKLEQNYKPSEVEVLVHASAMYRKAISDAVQAIGTPDSAAANQIAGIATVNLSRALNPFLPILPEFLRHG